MHELLQQSRALEPAWMTRVRHTARPRRYYTVAKRALDLIGSGIGLVLLSPVLGAIALAIRLDSPGRAIFMQTRVGLGGAPFEMAKFRSMREGAATDEHREYVTQMITNGGDTLRNANGTYKLENDGRITRVGAWLRRTSLDELAQLINVFRGEMSLVGPRPPLPYEVALYGPRDLKRLSVKPGMTGLWQVSGRNETTFEQMVDLDLAYIAHRSILLDLLILARTVRVLVKERGA